MFEVIVSPLSCLGEAGEVATTDAAEVLLLFRNGGVITRGCEEVVIPEV